MEGRTASWRDRDARATLNQKEFPCGKCMDLPTLPVSAWQELKLCHGRAQDAKLACDTEGRCGPFPPKSWGTGRLDWKILQSKANTDRGAADRATAASPAKSSRDSGGISPGFREVHRPGNFKPAMPRPSPPPPPPPPQSQGPSGFNNSAILGASSARPLTPHPPHPPPPPPSPSHPPQPQPRPQPASEEDSRELGE